MAVVPARTSWPKALTVGSPLTVSIGAAYGSSWRTRPAMLRHELSLYALTRACVARLSITGLGGMQNTNVGAMNGDRGVLGRKAAREGPARTTACWGDVVAPRAGTDRTPSNSPASTMTSRRSALLCAAGLASIGSVG